VSLIKRRKQRIQQPEESNRQDVSKTPPKETIITKQTPSINKRQPQTETKESKTVSPASETNDESDSGSNAEVALNSPKAGANNEQAAAYKGISSSAKPAYGKNPKPPYPRTAKRRGYEGEVHLRVYVLESGAVGDITVKRPSGHEILDDTALDAVKKWIFVPAKKNGREVSSWVTVPVRFQLDNG